MRHAKHVFVSLTPRLWDVIMTLVQGKASDPPTVPSSHRGHRGAVPCSQSTWGLWAHPRAWQLQSEATACCLGPCLPAASVRDSLNSQQPPASRHFYQHLTPLGKNLQNHSFFLVDVSCFLGFKYVRKPCPSLRHHFCEIREFLPFPLSLVL